MTDDLAKRLRDSTEWYSYDAELKMKCADRIEELEAKLAQALWVPMEAFAVRTKAERETHCRTIRHGFKERRLLQAIFGEKPK